MAQNPDHLCHTMYYDDSYLLQLRVMCIDIFHKDTSINR